MKAVNASVGVWSAEKGDAFFLACTAQVGTSFRIGYIGDPIILHEQYPPGQYWLPFMQGAMLRQAPENYYDADTPQRHVSVRSMVLRPYRIPPGAEKMYVYENPDQYQLAFAEFKYASPGETRKLERIWMRRYPNKQLPAVKINLIGHNQIDDFIAWGRDVFRGRFALFGGEVRFEFEVDALLTTLRYRGTTAK